MRFAPPNIEELRARLQHTRWPDAIEGRGWSDGADVAYMRKLCDYWRTSFDWRTAEARLSRLPQFKTRLDDLDIHFIHVRGVGPNPKPLIIIHGWPSSFAEFESLIPLLTDPAAQNRSCWRPTCAGSSEQSTSIDERIPGHACLRQGSGRIVAGALRAGKEFNCAPYCVQSIADRDSRRG